MSDPAAICPACAGNPLEGTGYRLVSQPGRPDAAVRCECHVRVESTRILRRAGIAPQFSAATFASFEERTPEYTAFKRAVICWVREWRPPGERSRGHSLMLAGCTGSGKSHLATAALISVVKRHACTARVISLTDWFADLKATVGEGSAARRSTVEMLDELIGLDLVLLDDLGVTEATKFERDRLYDLINGRYNRRAPMIVTTNLQLDVIERTIEPRVASRLEEMCTIVPSPPWDWRKTPTE